MTGGVDPFDRAQILAPNGRVVGGPDIRVAFGLRAIEGAGVLEVIWAGI